ncbi:MAG TPA: TIGR03118 family protein [Candidatus Acidoferrales bacterium]|nr:TIGR03118 family protein [Candidatus Acidoferrales bacterium]
MSKARAKILQCLAAICVAALLLPAVAFGQYKQTNLVSDTGTDGAVMDSNLVNGWGLVSSPTSPFWVSDNNTGKSTLYSISNTAQGVTASKLGLVVTIPAASSGTGSPTGVVFNGTGDFVVTDPTTAKSAKALFIFSTLDGTISGWNPAVGPGGNTATIAANRSDVGAEYSGLAVGSVNDGGVIRNFLYAPDNGPNRRVDVFDGHFQLVQPGTDGLDPQAFEDAGIPKKFAPYGIQTICQGADCQIWVTYTALDKAESGFVDLFATDGKLLRHFALRGPLHSPWGIALAPANFGPMSNAILITNNISRGRIEAFDPNSGAYLGPLRDAGNKPIEIDGIWAIQFGQGAGANGQTNQLFFTAGPSDYANGLFGVISFQGGE